MSTGSPAPPVTFRTFSDGAIASVQLSRLSKRNALTRDMLHQLLGYLAGPARAANIRVVTLSAEGPVFCAGMDLAEMQATATDSRAGEIWRQDAQLYRDVLAAIWSLAVPTMAIVQGPAVAGGVGLVAACDIVLASDAATFSLPEPQRGITAAIVTPLLVHRVGAAAAGHLILSMRTWDAPTALRRGLCDEVVSAERLETASRELVTGILSGSPQALATTKQCWQTWSRADILSKLDQAVLYSAEARRTDDAREGLQAFLEKRKPAWAPPSLEFTP